jgi:N,N'-diacetylchitobiose transport system substrate-binding protein
MRRIRTPKTPREMRMNVRHIGAALLVAMLAVMAVGSTGAAGSSAANTLTVWLQNDAQNGWPELVASVNSQFEKSHPGWSVEVQYQTWPTHLQKFDATLAGGNPPDVKEMGNSEMTKYMAAGAFQDLTANRSDFDNSRNWLSGLAASARYNGKLYGVPYIAGSRVVHYRTDLFKKAGISKLPTSLAEYTADAKKLAAKNKGAGFSPMYIAGTDWYVALGFVYDYGGQIAITSKGKWIGTLDRPKALAGLAAFKKFFDTASRASKTTIETRPWPYEVYAQGKTASMIGSAWFSCCVGDKYKNVTKQFVMPSHTKGQPMPGFAGGSELAVPIGANKAAAVDWIAAFTSTESEKVLQAKGNVPNATNLLGNSVNERASRRTWFVPVAKNWVNVENGNILRTMLARILTGKMTIKEAAATASDNIAFTLNQP